MCSRSGRISSFNSLKLREIYCYEMAALVYFSGCFFTRLCADLRYSGQIQKGYIADIIAVKGNPLEDIVLIQQVDFVMKEGKVYKRP